MPKSKYKKRADGRYLVQIQIGYQPNGKPKYKNIYGKTQTELEKKVVEFRSMQNQGIVFTGNKMTLSELSDAWFNTCCVGQSDNTKLMYENNLKHIKNSNIAGIKAEKLLTVDFQQLLNDLSGQGLTRTVELVRNTLIQIFDWAVDNDLSVKNPVRKTVYKKPKRKGKRTLTEEEENKILNAEFTLKERTLLYLMLFAGLRRGEALALSYQGNAKNIDLKNKLLTVDRTLIFTGKSQNEGVISDTPKTDAGNRTIPIIEPLLSVMSEYIQSLDNTSGLLFTTQDGKPVTKSSYRKMWDGIIEKISGDTDEEKTDMTAHILRHTFATYLAVVNLNPKLTQRLMGHADIKVTFDVYTHLDFQSRYPNSKIFKYYNNFLVSQNSVNAFKNEQ